MRAWLKKEGFQEGDLRSANSRNCEYLHPMGHACYKGELNVCKWLFEVGAAADITKATNHGTTPMRAASDENHIPVQQWLALKGALTSDNANGHTDDAIIRRNIPDADQRTALLEWAMELVTAHKEFKRTFLVGALSPQKSALLWKLGSLDDATNPVSYTHLTLPTKRIV